MTRISPYILHRTGNVIGFEVAIVSPPLFVLSLSFLIYLKYTPRLADVQTESRIYFANRQHSRAVTENPARQGATGRGKGE